MTVTLLERPADVIDGELAEIRAAIEDTLGDRCKVEILGGNIIVSPLPRNLHLLIVTCVRRMLDDGCDRQECVVTERVEFIVDAHNSPQPDIAVVTASSIERDLEATASSARDALLVVEVTSPGNALDDRRWEPKYKAYAKGLVPVYLLIDPHGEDGPCLTLFTRPNGKRYLGEQTLPFDESLRLPEPFEAVVIDTSAFPVPRKAED